MRRRICFLLLLSGPLSSLLLAAPAPKCRNAKPAIIDAGTERNIAWVKEIVVSAPYAIRQDWDEHPSRLFDLEIIRCHKKDWNNQKDWNEFRDWVKMNMRVERIPGTKKVRIGFRAGTPKEQAAIVNVVVDDFLKDRVENSRTGLTRTLERARAIVTIQEAQGSLTKAQRVEAEERFKKDEEYVRTFPVLVEHAKAR